MLRFTPHVRASSHTLAGCGAAAVALRRATARSTDCDRCVARGFRGTPSAARSTLIVRILNRVGRRRLAGRRPLYRGRRRRGNDAAPDVGRLALSHLAGQDVRDQRTTVYLTRGRWRGIIAPSAGRRKQRPVRHPTTKGALDGGQPQPRSRSRHRPALPLGRELLVGAGGVPLAGGLAACGSSGSSSSAASGGGSTPAGTPKKAAISASASRAAARATSSTARASSPSPTRPA